MRLGSPSNCKRIISESCSIVLHSDQRSDDIHKNIAAIVTHLSVPAIGTFLRSKSNACSPMPHALIVAFGSVSWRPSKEMICSLTGTPDYTLCPILVSTMI